MKYETTNLDDAAYIAMSGYPFSVQRTGAVSANFLFMADDNFENIRSKFWKGEVNVRLDHWLAIRAALKRQVYGQVVQRVTAPSIAPTADDLSIKPGEQYWYRDGATVKAANFGKRPTHTDRIKAGNFFRTREAATNVG